MKRASAGISVMELLFVLLLAGLLAAAAVPRLPMGAVSRQSAKTAARQLAADLRWTRQLALADAAGNPSGYELRMEGGDPYTGYSVCSRQSGVIRTSVSFPSAVVCTGGRTFAFGPLGNLLSGSDTQIRLSAGNIRYTLTVIPATGAVLCRKEE
ncbi:MAG: hypothetical protein WHS88_05230 [Anaerohalosphaeraceae bacterium]